ncbi:fumarylacetoacetate hydrolase family protein [uncultured Methanobrevibacter sp.]|uniref:fumarylacetoacetate hydrolase family protein n=1 Tax=uncultured Methanobrevibacter sp. TaxID=253161 RepID=UPI0025D78CB4|nr:fumarylacetoacetate hydrolase family protein [uncultured Methanobrevibacter sp.]
MKFIRFISENGEKSGLINKENLINPLKQDYINYDSDLKDINFEIEVDNSKSYKLEDIKIIEPVKPSKIVCVGLNYIEHGEELNMDIPNEPKIFLKPSTTTIPHEEKINYPSMTNQVDYEGELAIVIGKKCKDIEANYARDYIFGYTILNDVTARDLQSIDGQWTRAKSFDTFCPIGPVINTNMDAKNQKIKTKVNGIIKQDSNTNNMIFDTNELLSFISKIMTLNSGDIIATGTPKGVGPLILGDIVEITIEDIGTLRNYI